MVHKTAGFAIFVIITFAMGCTGFGVPKVDTLTELKVNLINSIHSLKKIVVNNSYLKFSKKRLIVLAVGFFFLEKFFRKEKKEHERPITVNPRVKRALQNGKPVVALESTIITHGMPFPQNVDTALAVEQEIRANGATPATIVIIRGELIVGATPAQLRDLASGEATKVSVRDLADVMARQLSGGTTVAATMHIAALAGIRVFATGGIGGVHRGAGTTFDVSCDLPSFTEYPVAVVCAGPKAILDVPATAEYMETLGVPVVGFGTDTMPCFYSREHRPPIQLRHSARDAGELARMLAKMAAITPTRGALIVNPIPAAAEIPFDTIKPHIDDALRDAERDHVVGKDITPFLLARIAEITGNASLTANIALIKNNARVAAQVAVELSRLK